MTNEDKAQIVIKEICRYYNTDFETLSQRRRWRRIVEPRQMIFYFPRQFTELSLAEIGKYFCYDHATVISACNTVDGLIRFNGYSNKTCVMAGRIDFEIKSFDIKKQDKYMEQWVLSMGTL